MGSVRHEFSLGRQIIPPQVDQQLIGRKNALRLDYVIALNRSNQLTRVRMTHWMTLQPEGLTMLNVVTIRKLGIVIGRISEVFSHESDSALAPIHQ